MSAARLTLGLRASANLCRACARHPKRPTPTFTPGLSTPRHHRSSRSRDSYLTGASAPLAHGWRGKSVIDFFGPERSGASIGDGIAL